ncbi:hypothetical protein, partial [Mesorhizobium sp.]|uniref:hypothetical protein n=1 Tax=Mesorhizobium sp. TaxID=1871066 RepID=UPI0025F7EB77
EDLVREGHPSHYELLLITDEMASSPFGEPAVDVADEGLHEAIDDAKVVHAAAFLVVMNS